MKDNFPLLTTYCGTRTLIMWQRWKISGAMSVLFAHLWYHSELFRSVRGVDNCYLYKIAPRIAAVVLFAKAAWGVLKLQTIIWKFSPKKINYTSERANRGERYSDNLEVMPQREDTLNTGSNWFAPNLDAVANQGGVVWADKRRLAIAICSFWWLIKWCWHTSAHNRKCLVESWPNRLI